MTPQQKDALLAVLERLPAADLEMVTRFAEFLLSRSATGDAVPDTTAAASPPIDIPEPAPIPRPDNEKVVAAVKRLSQSYFMLDKKKMLGVTSDLVTQHVLQGRDAGEVIDELERLFETHYRKLKQNEAG